MPSRADLIRAEAPALSEAEEGTSAVSILTEQSPVFDRNATVTGSLRHICETESRTGHNP
jgi:hypothetical protein